MSPRRFPLTRWLQKTIYIQFTHDWIKVVCVEDQRTLEDIPIIARNDRGHVIAFGAQAQPLGIDSPQAVVNPFTHPRTCIGDFDAAEATLRAFVRAVLPRSWVKPAMIMHPLRSYEGGLTQVEIRALSDLLLNLGAKQTYVWVGRPLTDAELRQLQFPVSEGALHSRDDPLAAL